MDAQPQADRSSWDEYSAQWSTMHLGVGPRRSSAFVDAWLRVAYGVGRVLTAMGVQPGAVTLAGLLASALVPVVVLFGGPWLLVAAGLVVVAAVADSADGAVAVISSRTSRLGAFYDSMADRLSEAAWLLALWLLGVPGVLVTICGGLVWLHEYARARAAVSGMTGVGALTVAERPTRVILMTVALVFGSVASTISPRLAAGTMTVVVAVWVVLGILGAARLLGTIRRDLSVRDLG